MQGAALPLIVPGCTGIDTAVTARVLADEEPQTLFAVTLTVPLLGLAVAVIAFVVLVPVQAVGRLQVYEAVLDTGTTEYTAEAPLQIVAGPPIRPGCAGGVFTLSTRLAAAPVPQTLTP